MTRLEIEWPDAREEQVRAARGRLECAGEALRAMPLEQRLQSIAGVVEDWTAPDSSWRRELAIALASELPLDEKTVREGLEAGLRAWRSDDLVQCARRELAPLLQSDRLELSPFSWTAVLAGGTVPMPTILSVLLPLILGSPVLLRETSHDPATARLLKRSLQARDESLARSFETVSFPTNDIAFDSLLEAPCIVATGSDQTIAFLSSRIRPSQRFVAYGQRFSIAVVGPDLDSHDESIRPVAEGLALDVARWDQTGCLSPVVVYVVGGEPAIANTLARAIAKALEELSDRMPRGEVPMSVATIHAHERAEARMRRDSDTAMSFEGKDYTVLLEADARPRPAPLYRFLRVMPVRSIDELEQALKPFAGQLSNVATAGFATRALTELRQRVGRFGASRFTLPGQLQTPPIDWPHDGMPLLTPMARFIGADASPVD